MPRALQQQIQNAIQDALARPELREAYAKQYMTAPPRRTLEEAADFVNAKAAKWQRVMREGGVGAIEMDPRCCDYLNDTLGIPTVR